MEEFLRIKTPKWRREGVIEELEDMGSYFRSGQSEEIETWAASLLRL